MTKIPSKYRHFVRDRLRDIRTKLGLRAPSVPASPINASIAPAPTQIPPDFSREVGFRDYLRKGWFNNATRELFPGFRIDPGDTVLDMGCGPGAYLKFCAQFAFHSIGVDISADCVKAAEESLRAAGVERYQVIQSDGNPLPLGSELADKVVCTEVFEHVDDPRVAIQELVRVGKPGASYLLSVPGELSEKILKELAPAACFEKPNHIRVFSSNDFRDLVEQAGLIIERHEFVGFYGAVWHALLWKCGADYDNGTHPVLEQWARTWEILMALPQGNACIDALDRALHKSQVIIARKPT